MLCHGRKGGGGWQMCVAIPLSGLIKRRAKIQFLLQSRVYPKWAHKAKSETRILLQSRIIGPPFCCAIRRIGVHSHSYRCLLRWFTGGAGSPVGATPRARRASNQLSTIDEGGSLADNADSLGDLCDLTHPVRDDADLPALGYTLNKFMVDNLMANLRVRCGGVRSVKRGLKFTLHD